MGLIKCSECGKRFSDKALSCPECSCPTSAVMNCQEKSIYIELLKEKADSLSSLNDEKEKRKVLYECVCFLVKIQNEKEKISFDNYFNDTRDLLNKLDNIDEKYFNELDIPNYEEILDFISKGLLTAELIDIQKKYNEKVPEYRRLFDDEIEESIESEVEYYYRNRQNSNHGVFYFKKDKSTTFSKLLNTKTYFYSFEEKGLSVRSLTSTNEIMLIYDKKLMEDCKVANSVSKMYINQYILEYSLYCFLKEKKKISFNELYDFIEKELKYIIPEATNNEIISYISVLFVIMRNYYKIEENNEIVLYEENENNEENYLYWSKEYERYFKFINQYLRKNNTINLNMEEYKKIEGKYEKELDGMDYPRLLMLCRILTCNDILKSNEKYNVFEINIQLLTNLTENIKSIVLQKEEISLNNLEKEIYQKKNFKSHLKLYLLNQICNCIEQLESNKVLIAYKKNEETFISIYSDKIEKEKKIKKQEEIDSLQAMQKQMNNYYTPPGILRKEIKLYTILSSKKEVYLRYFENFDEYDELSELFDDLADNYNEYARTVLRMPLQPYKPMSSSTAGTLGTIAGGLSAGILASEKAEKKMLEYNESQKQYFSSKSNMDIARENAEESYYMIEKILYKNKDARNDWIQARNECIKSSKSSKTVNDGCYIATCVYGSYDCPQVWTLRRYRDNDLGKTWYGRLFIKIYYAISPKIVKLFGKTKWFKKICQGKLDKIVNKLQNKGYESTPYQDINWR